MKKKKHLQKDKTSEIIYLLSENSTGKHDECIVWNGRRDARGYGVINGLGERNKKTGTPTHSYAHRVSYAVHKGEIPEGMCVCHHCDNPPCINPLHLFLGTKGDNIRDCVEKGRRPKSYKNKGVKTKEIILYPPIDNVINNPYNIPIERHGNG